MIKPNFKFFFFDDESKQKLQDQGVPIESDENCEYCGLSVDLSKLKRNFEMKLVHEHRLNGKVTHKYYDVDKCTEYDFDSKFKNYTRKYKEPKFLKNRLCPKI